MVILYRCWKSNWLSVFFGFILVIISIYFQFLWSAQSSGWFWFSFWILFRKEHWLFKRFKLSDKLKVFHVLSVFYCFKFLFWYEPFKFSCFSIFTFNKSWNGFFELDFNFVNLFSSDFDFILSIFNFKFAFKINFLSWIPSSVRSLAHAIRFNFFIKLIFFGFIVIRYL